MATVTDPARELAEIAQKLDKGSRNSGESFLAEEFEVDPWSTDFVKIIASILERIDVVASIVQNSDLDDDHQANALEELENFKLGFTGNSLRQPWHNDGNGLTIMKKHGRPIQYLSHIVRTQVRYPKLSDAEVDELIKLIDAYVAELRKSDEGPEFVRQAIFDGLAIFRFQLERLGWMGSGYALNAFRDVIFAYEVSKKHFADAELDPAAALHGLWSIVSWFKEKVDSAQGWADTGNSLWSVYRLGTAVATPLLLIQQVHPD